MADNNVNGNWNGHDAVPLIRFEDMAAHDASDSSNRRYDKPPSEYVDHVWHLGWTDGRCGQPPGDNEAILRARGHLHWQQMRARAEAEVGRLRALAESLSGSVTRLGERVGTLAGLHLKLLEEKRTNPQAFSLSLWVIYTTAAVLLLAADLPLSLKLVAMGYGVTTVNREDQRSVDDLLKDPYYVVSEFWEAMLLALGIALAGIFVKYFLDAILYREEQRGAGWWFKVSLSGVFTLFFITTILLGVFRSDVQRQQAVNDLTKRQTQLRQQLGSPPDPRVQKAINDTEQEIAKERDEGRMSVRTISFIALTLLFPITGGICFSVGWRKIIKYWGLRQVGKELAALESAFRAESLGYEEARSALEAREAQLARELSSYSTADDYAEMLVNLYRHGYMRGLNVPETIDAGDDLYQRCEKAVARLLAGKMRSRYWGSRPSPHVN